MNIIRDDHLQMEYYVTPNASKTAKELFDNFDRGIHAFNLIGSFGTGKSSFIWALGKSLKGEASYFNTPFNGKTTFIKIVGDHLSLKSALNDAFDIKEDYAGNQKLFDAIFQKHQETIHNEGLLVIAIDEFGKFLEYAAKNNPEDEIYFFQKLAEFVNAPDRNILLLNAVHQSLESYAYDLDKNQIQEWRKVRGRFKDLTFNEPVEQLLFLAASYLSDNQSPEKKPKGNSDLIPAFRLFNIQNEYIQKIEHQLFPLSAISGYTVALALQRYGQNERSLFTFLNSIAFAEIEDANQAFELPEVYDYLFERFYTFIVSNSNPDYANWAAIKHAMERMETIYGIDIKIASSFLKALGLLTIFSKKGSRLDSAFFKKYYADVYTEQKIDKTIQVLTQHKIIRYSKFDFSYKLSEGTDLDIDKAILNAEHQIESSIDILSKLNAHFDFPVVTAKSITYKFGTPRLFEFVLSNQPITYEPTGEMDGFINLIFSEQVVDETLISEKSIGKACLFGYFSNTTGIFKTLFEIEKTKKVLKDVQDDNDRVAIRELKSIIKSQEKLLSHYVMDSLYTNRVSWFANGSKVSVKNKKDFNKILSSICEAVYSQTPVIRNELINRHKVSSSIATARRNYWKTLVNDYSKEDMGFSPNKWPAEKTIYYTLLKKTGIHQKSGADYTLGKPLDNSFQSLWMHSEVFLDDTKTSRKPLTAFVEALSTAPIKLKQGVIDFWIPTFLFIKRGDFALYGDTGFIPYIDEHVLYMMTRNPKAFYIKSFELNNLRLGLFNKYRAWLNQEERSTLDTSSFIESIRPLLVFYRDLTEYGRNTKTLSPEALHLREAIAKATDPEKTFFEAFPQALGYSLKDLAADNRFFDDYIIQFQQKIQEIKTSFAELLDRFELLICDAIIGKETDFETYKSTLQKRFEAIKAHETLTRHKIFLLRVNSGLNDRNSYLMSLAQALLGKPLDKIRDAEEPVLKQKMRSMIKELDNLVDLNTIKTDEDALLIKLELTTKAEGLTDRIIRLPKDKLQELERHVQAFSSELDKNDQLKLPILVSLLKKELEQHD